VSDKVASKKAQNMPKKNELEEIKKEGKKDESIEKPKLEDKTKIAEKTESIEKVKEDKKIVQEKDEKVEKGKENDEKVEKSNEKLNEEKKLEEDEIRQAGKDCEKHKEAKENKQPSPVETEKVPETGKIQEKISQPKPEPQSENPEKSENDPNPKSQGFKSDKKSKSQEKAPKPKPKKTESPQVSKNLSKTPKIEEIKETKETKSSTPENPALTKHFHPPADLHLPTLSEDQMSKGIGELKNMSAESITQMAKTLKSMDPRLMQSVFKAQGIDMPPDQIAKMAEVLTPETINIMSEHFGKTPQKDQKPEPKPKPQTSEMLNNPEKTQMASEMLAQQLGSNPEDVQIVLKAIGKFMGLLSGIRKIYNIFTMGNRKYLTISVLMVFIAYYIGMISL
jgi:hypothetical protein